MLKAHIGPEIGLCTDHFSQPQHQLLKFSKFAPAPRNAIFTNSCASRRREYGDAAPECQVTEGDGSNEECNDPPVSARGQESEDREHATGRRGIASVFPST